MKIALFGGTFDPPHKGHLALAETVLRKNLAELVLFMPAWIPPHKAGAAASFGDRVEMVKRMIDGRSGMRVSAIESEREGKSYTFDTVQILRERFPGDEFVLLIGGDSLLQLHTWHRAEELVKRIPVLCCPREGAVPALEQLLPHWERNIAEKLMSGVITDFVLRDDASSELRKELADGKKTEKVDERVLEYISQRRLYMGEQEKTKKLTSKELACFCAAVADDRKASDIIVLDMTDYSVLSEFYVICTGTSAPHLRAISEKIQREAREKLAIRARIDGTPESKWMIADFGNVMVHIFTGETRELYQLENLWGDAPRVNALPENNTAVKPSRLC